MKLQKEIDEESENKSELMKAKEETTDLSHKEVLNRQISKSDEKVEAMMMMMLHYCSGLQYCLDQEEEEKQKSQGSDRASGSLRAHDSLGASCESGSISSSSSLNVEEDEGSSKISKASKLKSKETKEFVKKRRTNFEDDESSVNSKEDCVDSSLPHVEDDRGKNFLESESEIKKPVILVEHVVDGDFVESSNSGENLAIASPNDSKTGKEKAYGEEFRLNPDESELLDEELVSEVLQTVTEIIEASEGGSDSSDEEDITMVTEAESKVV